MKTQGLVFDIKQMTFHDGPGVRTTVFFKGCPLRCIWCHNPEGQSFKKELMVSRSSCTGCGKCSGICPSHCECDCCETCVTACPLRLRKVAGKLYTSTELAGAILKNRELLEKYNGGVTFSGGEPGFQAAFLRALALEFDKRGISMTLETCGYFNWDEIRDVIFMMSHVLYDIKHMDDGKHRELTGVSNKTILENCIKICNSGIPLTVRIPLIKNLTGTRKNIEDTALFMKKNLPGASVELLPYHGLGLEKYRAIGLDSFLHDEYEAPEKTEIKALEDIFRTQGIAVRPEGPYR